ncbi:MAG: hypothetical protein K9I95_00705 [Flavobacteriaceae bacterium]|nr:hypothetical protein [Flavobacteriaceae bacterium]
MKIKCFVLVLLGIISSAFSQTNLNDYKYVIVPKKYDFLKEENQYQINSLAKFLFQKYGFETLMEGDDYPLDLAKDRCLALKSNLINDSGLFKTKLKIVLKACNDKIVYESQLGETREKEYDKAYNLALREAFKSLETLNYKYEPKETIAIVEEQAVATEKNETAQEIQKLKQEIEALKQEKIVEVITIEPVKEEPAKAEVITETPNEEINMEPVLNVLYAQQIENGFQLVDSTPKVVYKIKKTGLDNVYLVENMNATLYKKGDQWILEYYENSTLKQKALTIKF